MDWPALSEVNMGGQYIPTLERLASIFLLWWRGFFSPLFVKHLAHILNTSIVNWRTNMSLQGGSDRFRLQATLSPSRIQQQDAGLWDTRGEHSGTMTLKWSPCHVHDGSWNVGSEWLVCEVTSAVDKRRRVLLLLIMEGRMVLEFFFFWKRWSLGSGVRGWQWEDNSAGGSDAEKEIPAAGIDTEEGGAVHGKKPQD